MTLACQDANSKFAEVFTVVDVDDEDEELLFRRFGQDFEVEVQARFEAGLWSVFCCCSFVGL